MGSSQHVSDKDGYFDDQDVGKEYNVEVQRADKGAERGRRSCARF